MKLVSLTLENFRGYREPTKVKFNNLTVFIGKNDMGKSTILDALDIFFENSKLDNDDINIEALEARETVNISAVFSNPPNEIDIDAGAKTNLKDEYLLNSDGFLEIKKEFKSPSKISTFIVCNHPTNENANDLHSLKITALQKRIRDLSIEGDFRASVKNDIRKAIWDYYSDDLSLGSVDIEIKQEGVKDIWSKIHSALPLFALFQSDRKNNEKDKEVQDPLKFAAKKAFSKYIEDLNVIKAKVEQEVRDLADLTIEKLKEMNKDVAEQLSPQFPSELKWHSLLNPTLTSDEIPMNKRGSGVRRLILINFGSLTIFAKSNICMQRL